MAARTTGFAMLASASVQEAHDFALIAHAATLRARIPFLHFFDGFRTSHEVAKILELGDDDLRFLIDDALVAAHRGRALTPDRPVLRGTAQNPDVFFQAREAANSWYDACPQVVQTVMDRFGAHTGRAYHLFDYVGAPDADRFLVAMGSGAEAAEECVDALRARGEKVGLVRVRLYRPFSLQAFLRALPRTTRSIAVTDRTKEPGAPGEPLYLDVVNAIAESCDAPVPAFAVRPRVIGGRYGLASKEFTPAMVKAVFEEMKKTEAKNHFTVGIRDDVTGTSLAFDPSFTTEGDDVFRAVFYGLGSDGTVGANKNSIKIIGEETDLAAQGYFVYDSKKAGSITVSHLRFGGSLIRSSYLIQQAHFVACHHPLFLDRQDILAAALPGGVFLLNTPVPPEHVWDTLTREAQEHLVRKRLKLHVIDAFRVAREAHMGGRINTIMQTCFFAISGVLPRDQAIACIKKSIVATYGKKGASIVEMNFAAVDRTLEGLHEVTVPAQVTATRGIAPAIGKGAPAFLQQVTAPIIAGQGDDLPVSALPCDGTFPLSTSRWEKRSIAHEIPIWDAAICTQCGKCAIVCPPAAIRSKVYAPAALARAPAAFRRSPVRGKDFQELGADWLYTIQVAPEDCTGCGICIEVCPAKSKEEVRHKAINLCAKDEHLEEERTSFEFFLGLPEADRAAVKNTSVRGSQLLQPLFEASGACVGCGETPYLKLMSQLFGDRALVANATGCSSIYGGNLPTTPWSVDRDGRGPAWSNSLFEDNAEFGLGFRISLDKQHEMARELLQRLAASLDAEDLVHALLQADQSDEAGIRAQRERVVALRQRLAGRQEPEAARLRLLADALVKKSVWIVGGDGWAYDIGFGGLDHVLASGRDVNILVLDTEVYSNTGGQMSKSTPRAAVAKFASAGKPEAKKDLGLIALTYGNVYVARVAMGANDAQTIRTLIDAESYPGPSLVIAYSHCIAHGIDMRFGMTNQKLAVQSGHWPLFRFDPRRAREGKNPLQLDSKPPSISLDKYLYAETRFKMLQKALPERARQLLRLAQGDVDQRWRLYAQLAALPCGEESHEPGKTSAPRASGVAEPDSVPGSAPGHKVPAVVEGET
jgi:pyruvate-ferredoxin/flavodoxin oxidoreductase